MKEKIRSRVRGLCWDEDLNCARTMLTCPSELSGIPIEPRALQAAVLRCGGRCPQGFSADDPPHACEKPTRRAVDFARRHTLGGSHA